MYLIIKKPNHSGERNVMATDDMHYAAKCLDDGYLLFKINNMTPISSIEITYNEIPLEMHDD